MLQQQKTQLLRKRKTAVIPNEHFYDAKTKSKQGVMAVWSLKLTFTEMLMRPGTMHPLCETFIFRWCCILGAVIFCFFLSWSWMVSSVNVMECHYLIKEYYYFSITTFWLHSWACWTHTKSTIVLQLSGSPSVAEHAQRAVPFADRVIACNLKSDANYKNCKFSLRKCLSRM